MQDPIPDIRDLVLIGGGHAYALVLRMWAMRPVAGVRLTLINPNPATPYTGMLPGLIAGHYARDEIMIDLVRLARFAGARLILDSATGLDTAARTVHLQGRAPLTYDLAALDIGITSDLDLPGFASHAAAARPLGRFADQWADFVARALPAPRLVIVGSGVGGVELALSAAQRLRAAGSVPDITLLDRSTAPLSDLPPPARRHLLAELARAGVTLLCGASPALASATSLTLQDGRILPSDFTLTVAGSRPQRWLAATGLTLHDGYVAVDATLQTSDPQVFASGDCAHLTHAPRPKAGVFAVRAAPILLHNLQTRLTDADAPLRRFDPQSDYLKLISLGGKSALATKYGLALQGPRLWALKDRIDRAFMAKFADYPTMSATATLPDRAAQGLSDAIGHKALCGACGAKIGPLGLSALSAALPKPQRADVVAGPGDDAAILRVGAGFQVITTDHLRASWLDPGLMARIAATHALGDIWAMGATPQAALAQITLPRLSEPLQARTLSDIMQAAAQVFGSAGADIVGGHSAIGAELTLGFTVTGLTATPVTKGGARPGAALILTKPIGSGTIMAAEMAMARLPGLILGEAVAAAHRVMLRPLAPASAILAPQAQAMTDVTGFGLAGHLIDMLIAADCAATLSVRSIPLLPGAMALSAAGHESSIAPANRAALSGRISGAGDTRTALLFDPQTCGGLLAAVPADQAADLLAALHHAGDPDAALIGHLTRGAPHITLTD